MSLPRTSFLVGIDDNHAKSLTRPDGLLAKYRELSFGGHGHDPLEARTDEAERTALTYLSRAAAMVARGQRVVIAVFGKPSDAPPVDAHSRTQYCEFLRHVLRHVPFRDIVIWNEANSPRFWPRSAGAPAYEALLDECWRRLHALRGAGVNVISTTAAHFDPAGFVRALGAAYRQRGMRHPILDTFGHNPYPENASEPPWVQHEDPATIGEGGPRAAARCDPQSVRGDGAATPRRA